MQPAAALVSAGRSDWGNTAPPLQARMPGHVVLANQALPPQIGQPLIGQLPATTQNGMQAQAPLAGQDWQPIATLPSGPRGRPEDLAAGPTAAQGALPAPAVPPVATVQPQEVRPAFTLTARRMEARDTSAAPFPEAVRGGHRFASPRAQAEARGQEFRRRWLIGNFY